MSEHKRIRLDDAIDVLLELYVRDRRTERGFEYLEITVAAASGWRDPKDLSLAWDALAAHRARRRNSLMARLRGWWTMRNYRRRMRRAAKAA